MKSLFVSYFEWFSKFNFSQKKTYYERLFSTIFLSSFLKTSFVGFLVVVTCRIFIFISIFFASREDFLCLNFFVKFSPHKKVFSAGINFPPTCPAEKSFPQKLKKIACQAIKLNFFHLIFLYVLSLSIIFRFVCSFEKEICLLSSKIALTRPELELDSRTYSLNGFIK